MFHFSAHADHEVRSRAQEVTALMKEAESTEKEESCVLLPVSNRQVLGKWGNVTRNTEKSGRQNVCVI